jgi:hypothetical protein
VPSADCAACCCPDAVRDFAVASPVSALPGSDVEALVAHLYVCRELSTYRIGEVVGMNRQRVRRLLGRAGVPVKSRGAGRPRPRRAASQDARTDLMAGLYRDSGWTAAQIAALTGVSQSTVRYRLRARGVRIRSRGPLNREDRVDVPADALVQLYVACGLSAVATGRLLGVSRQVILRAAHDEGLPVRTGGPEPRHGPSGPSEIQLIDALYADPLVERALSRYGIPLRPEAGPIWRRFPVPVAVSPQLAEELYVRCGLGVRHIELLTGQPSQTVLRLLAAHGVARRPAGGRTPFMRRWRATGASGGSPSSRGWRR